MFGIWKFIIILTLFKFLLGQLIVINYRYHYHQHHHHCHRLRRRHYHHHHHHHQQSHHLRTICIVAIFLGHKLFIKVVILLVNMLL
jgi:hypothetical protein